MDSKKRKRVVLSMPQKVEIINRLKQGETTRGLARVFGVGSSTIFDIKKNSEAILAFANEKGGLARKVMRRSDNERVEKVLYQWYLQKTAEGEKLTGPMLCETASAFNEVLGGDPNFRASSGWLARFRARHYISRDDLDKVPEDDEVIAKFTDKLRRGKCPDPDMLYSVGETILFWKELDEDKPTNNEKVTVLMCANSTGTHRLPLLVVAKGKQSNASDRLAGRSVVFMRQKDGWVSREVFLDWYDGHFVQEVQRFHEESGKTGKVLLLMDQAMSRPSPEALRRHNDQFTVFIVPDSVSNNLLPIKQGIMKRTIELYREQLLGNVLTLTDDDKSTAEFWEKLGLKEAMILLSEAWAAVESQTITEAWAKITGIGKDQHDTQVPIKKEIETPENTNDRTEMLTEDSNETDLKAENTTGSTEGTDHTQTDSPSHKDALNAIETLLNWMEKQDEVHSIQILQVKKLREIANMKDKLDMVETSLGSCPWLIEPATLESSDKEKIGNYRRCLPSDHETYTLRPKSQTSNDSETQPNRCFAVLRTVNPSEIERASLETEAEPTEDDVDARLHLRRAMKHSKEAMIYSKEALKHNSEALKLYSKFLDKSEEMP